MDEIDKAGRVYTPVQVAVASFVGGPLPACWMAAHNASEMRRPAQRAGWLIAGVIGTALVFYVGLFLLPDWVPPYLLPVAYTLALREGVRNVQGSDLSDLGAAGAKQGSWGVVIGFALAGLALMLGIVAVIVFKFPAALPRRIG